MVLFLKNLVFTSLVPGTVAGAVPWLVVRERATSGNLAVAAVLFAVGTAIYLWCLWDFASFGRATPAPIDAPRRLVVRGLYRYTRNPMYVGVLIVILGWATLFESMALLLYAACVALVVHLFVVFYEEPHLRELFGVQYENYCSRVARWVSFRQPR